MANRILAQTEREKHEAESTQVFQVRTKLPATSLDEVACKAALNQEILLTFVLVYGQGDLSLAGTIFRQTNVGPT